MPRVEPDANDVMVLYFDDGPSTFVNRGTTGAVDNWTAYGSPISGVQGLLGDAVYMPSQYISSNHDGIGGANDRIVSPHVSLSGWVFWRRSTNYAADLMVKQYFLDDWFSPFLTFGFQSHSANDQMDLYITIGGVLQTVLRTPSSYPIPVGRWFHLGGTWDGTTLRMYINGTPVTSSTPVGVIDYNNSSARGRWFAGAIPGSGTNQGPPAIIQDVRVANIARPQSYFANIYYNGFIT